MDNRQDNQAIIDDEFHKKLRRTLQNLQNVIFTFVKSDDGAIVYTLYEGKIAQELGLTTDMTYGKTLHQVFPDDQAEYLSYYYNKALTGETVTYEFEYAGRVFHNVLEPITEDGKIVEVVGSAIDISKRKKAELELSKARDQALLSTRLKSEFLSTMSHEIRTPMNGIIGMLEVLMQSTLTDKQLRYASIAHDSAYSLLSIINDILDFSKMEAGKMQLEVTDFNLLSLVEDTIELMAAKAYEKRLFINSFVDPSLPMTLRGDSGRIRQVLYNLIGNAIKFTLEGKIVVLVTSESSSGNKSEIRFSVSDTGIGIPNELSGRLFEPFTQADGSTTRNYGGTGLGLSISKRLVELMNGRIYFKNNSDAGATFWFTLPFEDSPQLPLQKPNYPTLRLLFVMNDDREFQLINESLSALGVRSELAVGPNQAIKTLQNQALDDFPYDCLILDSETENLLQFHQQLTEDPSISGIKKILLLPFSDKDKYEHLRNTGFSAYLTRPIKQSQLSYVLQILLQKTEPKHANPDGPNSHLAVSAKSNRLILLVEDNIVNREIVMLYLERLGLNPHTAENGNEALESVAQHHFDLILMDCQMPEMNGYETTRKIRQIELTTGRHVPIIALTANAMSEDRDRCIEAGMDDYLCKPFMQQELGEILNRWLPPASESGDLLNENKFLYLFQHGDPSNRQDKLRQFITTFEHHNIQSINIIRDLIRMKDREAISKMIHSVKSGSNFIGAVSMTRLFQRLENLDCSAYQEEALEILSDIYAELLKTCEYLRTKLL